jgi:hypothetical protein
MNLKLFLKKILQIENSAIGGEFVVLLVDNDVEISQRAYFGFDPWNPLRVLTPDFFNYLLYPFGSCLPFFFLVEKIVIEGFAYAI